MTGDAPGPGSLLAGALRALTTGGPLGPRRLLVLLLLLPPFVALQLCHWLGFVLDDLLVPEYRDTEVRAPLFVVGLPRSGTTTLHRVLALDDRRFTTLRLWQLVFAPSITERRIVEFVARIDAAVGRPGRRVVAWLEALATGWFADVHPVSLADAEEDYLFWLPAWASFILVLVAPHDERLWELATLDRTDPPRADRLVAFYRRCVQRHLWLEGDGRTLLSKNPSFSPVVKALDRAFPDCHFVACFREPEKAVASQLSSLEDAARILGWRVGDPLYRDRILATLRYYGEHLVAELPALPPERHTFTFLSRMASDMDGTVAAIYARFGWTPTPEYLHLLEAEGRRARRHTSRHHHRLGDYGLSGDDVAPLRRIVDEVRRLAP